QNVGTGGGGGGYGGEGGTTYGGITYGSATAPVDLGSGGFGLLIGSNEVIPTGGYGGGRIQLNVSDTLTVNGTLSANGGIPHSSGIQNGGGSGGSIYVLTESFTGSGAITANGGKSGPVAGSGAGGGGGGGRIAIFHRQAETYTGVTTATGGTGVGDNGDDGTVIISQSELAVSPDTGGDSGEVTILASGSVFQEGAYIKLTKSGQSDIIGDQIKVLNDGLVLSAVFDLTNAANGAWDVVVVAPDISIKEISNGFTIEEGDEGGLWVDIIGRDLIRPNREQKFHITYGNSSNVDADSADIFLEMPTGVEYKFDEDTSFKMASDTTFVHIIDTYVPSGSRKLVPVRVKKNAAAGTNFSLGVAISTHDQSVDADTDHFSKLSTDVTKGILVQQQQQQQSSSSSSGPYADPIKFPGELDNTLATGFVVVTVMSDARISSGKQFKEVGFVDGDVVKFNYPYRDPDPNKRNDVVEFTVDELKAGIIEIGNADVFVDLRFAVRPETEDNMEITIAEQMSSRFAQFNFIEDYNDPNDQGIRFCNPPTECDKNKFELSCKGTLEHLLYAQPIAVPPDNIRFVFDLSMLPYNQ
ncbi:MAG: hypothetical protein K8I00_07185, partial [Candidatus Omnitrophica bacterium]|nr:hypothetical protein [Candidatus Omnitrophota bacterium]